MQGVIGQFESMTEAELAVRNLEPRGLSIQNIIVADQQQRKWRRLRGNAVEGQGGVLVCMIDEPQNIERARAFLSASR
jgi:hypothetical protein